MGIFDNIFGNLNEREINKINPIIALINDLEQDYEKLSDEDLKAKTAEFKKRIIGVPNSESSNAENLDGILPEAFAAVREASKRKNGQRHYDVQLIAGVVLHQGKIAEMKTGEGKTLVATLPLYLNALEGKGCHLVTPNDYLSRVGGGWMGPIYHALGITVAVVSHEFSAIYDPEFEDETDHGDDHLNHWRPCTRKDAYNADITYGTNNEFGFDYLRDNMATDLSQVVQRPVHYAIVDEVDSILIDEARTPLIISAPAEESASLYAQFAGLVKNLKTEDDYKIDEKEHNVTLTDEGMKKVERMLGLGNIYDAKTVNLVHHLEESLKAHALFKKNKDYVVKDGEIIIVDEFTGRLMQGRRYSEGLHQAIEAKEGVEVKRESDTLATITFQNLFRMYKKLSGMTGTAATEAEEFSKIYNLEVVVIPTNRDLVRIDKEDNIYKTEEAKLHAVIEDVKERNKNGQPVLIGTVSIQKNEFLSRLLKQNGVRHQLLNAKHHEREAKIIADAGRLGAVTLATNMAGRGVDILLGGKIQDDPTKEEIKAWEEEREKILALGGLYVVGTERHEARRIDNQLRGRAGRQGDPGESQFYVSLEDDLMRIFGGDKMKGIMDRLGLPDDQAIHHKMISNSIETAQKKVEGHNFDIRKHLVDYDDVMNKHREVIYRKRRKILELDPKTDDTLHEEIMGLLSDEERPKYLEKITKIGLESMRYVEKMIYLRTIDTLWIEHLNTMTELREGIGLRGYAQRDPLVEYKEQAYNIFERLIDSIENQIVEMLLKLEVKQQPAINNQPSVNSSQLSARPVEMQGADESSSGGAIQDPKTQNQSNNDRPKIMENIDKNGVNITVRERADAVLGKTSQVSSQYSKVGRNDPCPCGATKSDGRPIKYKHCHGK